MTMDHHCLHYSKQHAEESLKLVLQNPPICTYVAVQIGPLEALG